MWIAAPLLQDGAGVVRSQDNRDYGGGTIHWRAYSSAGALFPVEVYVAAASGLYSFDPLAPGSCASAATFASGLVSLRYEILVLTGIHARTGWKYMERGYRHVWWDAGTMLANLLALAAAEGLEPILFTRFRRRHVNEALGVDGEHEYALALLGSETGGVSFPLARRAHAASRSTDADAVDEPGASAPPAKSLA